MEKGILKLSIYLLTRWVNNGMLWLQIKKRGFYMKVYVDNAATTKIS